MQKIKHFFNKPFPQEESLFVTLRITAAISIFVVVFLYIFRPFGLHTIESGYAGLCLGFGLISFATSMTYEWIVVRVLKFKGEGARFTFGRWIAYFVGVMLLISVANFLYIRLTVMGFIDWSLFPYMIRSTFAIGFFPIMAVGGWALLAQEKKYQGIADEFNRLPELEEVDGASDDVQVFEIPASRIRYVEAMQNYIKIACVDRQGQLSERVERATLKGLSSTDLGNSIVRCHRSFLVNRDAITSTAGNAANNQSLLFSSLSILLLALV